jgi:hypothetical protein
MFEQQLLTAILAWCKANGARSVHCIDYHRHLFRSKVTILWLVVVGVNPPEALASLRAYLLPIFGDIADLEVFNSADL